MKIFAAGPPSPLRSAVGVANKAPMELGGLAQASQTQVLHVEATKTHHMKICLTISISPFLVRSRALGASILVWSTNSILYIVFRVLTRNLKQKHSLTLAGHFALCPWFVHGSSAGHCLPGRGAGAPPSQATALRAEAAWQ